MKEAVVAVIRTDGRVLVIRRARSVRMPGYWSPLSGTIESGESQPEALVREVREEVGLEVRAIARVWECPTDDGSFRLHWWTAEVVGGYLRPDPDEVEEARWVTPGEFQRLTPTFFGDRQFFEQILPDLE